MNLKSIFFPSLKMKSSTIEPEESRRLSGKPHPMYITRTMNTIRSYLLAFAAVCVVASEGQVAPASHQDSLRSTARPMAKECIQRDTLTASGTRIHYEFDGEGFRIVWGDRSYTRASDSTYSCDFDPQTGLWDFVPKFHSETKNHLVFTNILWTSSGGNPAPLEEEAIVLPKNLQDSIAHEPFFIDAQGDYLVYGDPNNGSIHISNLETNQNRTFPLSPEPALLRSPTMPIRKTRIAKGELYVQYLSIDRDENEVIVRRIFAINSKTKNGVTASR